MATANLAQTNFTSGEISPKMQGRVDLTKYANGAETLENFLVYPQGGITRRPGTVYVGDALHTTPYSTVLVPFSFNTTQSYILEVSTGFIRVFKNDAVIQTFATPWVTADIPDLKWCQSADTLYVTHPYYSPQKITRNAAEVFSIVAMDHTDGPYMSVLEKVTAYVTGYSHTGTLTAITGAIVFAVGDINKYIEFRQDGIWKLAKITARTSNSVVTVTVLENILADFDTKNVIRLKKRRATQSPGTGGGTPNTNVSAIRVPYQNVGAAGGNNAVATTQVTTNRNLHPNAVTTFGAGVITSTYAGTFTRQDIGKYVRVTGGAGGAGVWYLITGYTDDTHVAVTVAGTMKGYTYPGDSVELTAEARVCLLSVRAGGTDGLGSSYFVNANTYTGRHVRFNFAGTQCWGIIAATAPPDTKSVYVTMYDNIPRDANDGSILASEGVPDDWRLGAWYGIDTAGNYPGTVCFHEQRLCFARSDAEPQTVWMSRTDDYQNFSPTEADSAVVDDNAVTYTIVGRQVNEIRWLESGPVLLIGTSGGEWQVKAASNVAAPITPSNITVTQQSTFGSTVKSRGVRIGPAVLFLNRSGRKVGHLQYDFQLDQYVAKDLNIISDHILIEGGTTAREAVYQQEPFSTLWVLRNDGVLCSLTYQPDQEVYAWSKHKLGYGTVDNVIPVIDSIAVIPAPSGNQDYLYMVVRRKVDGSFIRFIERLSGIFEPSSDADKANEPYLDCQLVYSGVATTTITVTHLIHENVNYSYGATGIYAGLVSLVGTSLTVPSTTHATVGFSFDSKLKMLRPEGGSPSGTSQGKNKTINMVEFLLFYSRAIQLGRDFSNLVLQPNRGETGLESDQVNFMTGMRRYNLDVPWSLDQNYCIQSYGSYSLNIQSVLPHVHTTQ